MAVQNISRRSGPFTGSGLVTVFPFGFKVFLRSDVTVVRTLSADVNAQEETLKLDDDYTVTLNADQDQNPGGQITLASHLEEGLRLAVISSIEPDQQVVLTNHDGFLPETLNGVHDKAIALIQELKEEGQRTLKVPATSTKTPEQVVSELMAAQEEAKKYAEEAGQSAEAAAESERKTAEYAEAALVILPYKDVIATVADNIDSVNTVNENLDDILIVSDSIEHINDVAEHLPHLHEIWEHLPEIETVWEDRESIITVAESIGDVNAIAEHLPHLHELWEHLEHIHTVWEDLRNIDTVAGISQNVYEVSLIGPQIGNVSDHIEDVAKVSTCMEEVLAVADDMIVEYVNPDDINYGSVISYELEADEDYGDVTGLLEYDDVDYGNTGDTLTPAVIVKGGNIVAVGQHIDAVIEVSQHLDAVDEAAKNATEAIAAKDAAVAASESAEADKTLAHDWAVKMDGKVEDEDYSSKWYAEKAQEAANAAIEAADNATFQMVEQMVAFYNAYYDTDLDYRDYLGTPKSELLTAFYGFCEGYEGVTTV